jgi:ubiquinone biosynthesis protein COQ9
MNHEDLTLDELRLALAPEIAEAAAFDGWGLTALEAAAERLEVPPEVARLAFPEAAWGHGAMSLIAAWTAHIDAEMAQALPREKLAEMSIRQRIKELVSFRLDAARPAEEALRRALAIMAMPQNLRESLALGWHSADVMWRLAGDTATDLNHYSKRAILAAIYAATLLIFVDDTSEDKADTSAFLDRRIDGVMQFEKAKAAWVKRVPADFFSPARFLGRLRYPSG